MAFGARQAGPLIIAGLIRENVDKLVPADRKQDVETLARISEERGNDLAFGVSVFSLSLAAMGIVLFLPPLGTIRGILGTLCFVSIIALLHYAASSKKNAQKEWLRLQDEDPQRWGSALELRRMCVMQAYEQFYKIREEAYGQKFNFDAEQRRKVLVFHGLA